jgi:hypothetical protein
MSRRICPVSTSGCTAGRISAIGFAPGLKPKTAWAYVERTSPDDRHRSRLDHSRAATMTSNDVQRASMMGRLSATTVVVCKGVVAKILGSALTYPQVVSSTT